MNLSERLPIKKEVVPLDFYTKAARVALILALAALEALQALKE